ncbi:efflux RND transporter periplasmic adaptor subunit [Flavobacterium johnsoniae]|uniref:Efflux transporter, RND family, MFP subunit n=1 Tax=Flavobacterium johnsoniae (strain ATCC 17061 / DSM 2064 / JCM 8514 / BCRC 14874 / CCUG 350202 / NBRC 14942 / NCIMB 11054 / UW101) TaxID=376686 RepID=A5FCY2_FLAJ1|nr:efflux RND transporter periplasmic adaptor subunit [Flavobacterium johnsoniae]ABQ06942.1 efflux transporter, RND family, MFP subunit [Flavobacterium johnsoniae UW101]OXE97201.1 efflux transporter periplasmic adaptor subunit [Flavobacterium johnsoniae UW101]WQG81224.1 efflux RND transporter periplasmic adaptor subunit [Flavobacterium johnsoniae UW101]SHL35732.1 membrane fusion protein, cobalt-zinc-cadmium efflux system [Flavobacterium johnsoniae]
MKTYITAVLCLVLMISCKSDKKEEQKTEVQKQENTIELSDSQVKNARLATGNPEEKNVKGILELQGTVTVPPKSVVSVSIPLGGYIKKTDLMAGMHVRKGQLLAVVEDMQYIQLQQDYLTAKEKYQLSQSEYNRQKELNAKKASSDKLFEQTAAEMQTQRIYMASLAQKLSLSGINVKTLSASNISKTVSVLSPITGLVSKVNVNVGKYISPTDMLFELMETSDVVLVMNAFEKDVHLLSVGQTVSVFTNADPSKKYAAKIAYINQSLNGDRAAEVVCKLNAYNNALIPGLFINAEAEFENEKTLTVPEDAIVKWQNKFYVFSNTENQKYKMIPVETGSSSNGYRQIKSSLIDKSSKIVVKNAYTLLMTFMNGGDN